MSRLSRALLLLSLALYTPTIVARTPPVIVTLRAVYETHVVCGSTYKGTCRLGEVSRLNLLSTNENGLFLEEPDTLLGRRYSENKRD